MRRRLVMSLLVICLAMAPAVGSALADEFIGIDYGPYRGGGAFGSYVSDAALITDLGIIAQKFTYVRTYACDQTSNMYNFVPLAASNYPSLKIAVGVIEVGDQTTYNHTTVTLPQLQNAVTLANSNSNVYAIVVGNECLPGDGATTNPVSVAQLQTDLTWVKAHLTNPNVLVTTDFSYGGAVTYAANFGTTYCSTVMVNDYPFYAGGNPKGVNITQAMANFTNSGYGFPYLASLFPGQQVILGESGWPSAPTGTPYGISVPSVANEQTYAQDLISTLKSNGWSGFLFEEFDEAFKSNENPYGPNWGLYNADGTPKFSFSLDGLGSPPAVPVPGTIFLMGSGLLGLVGFGWRRRKS